MSEQKSIFESVSFEDKALEIRTYIIDHINLTDPELSGAVIESITNNSELLCVMVNAVAAYTVDNTRKLNVEANELSRLTVKSDNGVDRLVANNGLKRGVVRSLDDPNVTELESNESLLIRFDLSHYQANTTGTRYGYKFHALAHSLDERPLIEVRREGNKLIQTFTFNELLEHSNIADVEFRTIEQGTGKVIGAVTPKIGQVVDLVALLNYLTRPDIAQETDILSLKLATKKPYSVTVNAYTDNNPRYQVDKEELTKQCADMTRVLRRNEGRVSSHDFSHLAKNLNAFDVDIIGLDLPLVSAWDEYPECEELIINVLGKR